MNLQTRMPGPWLTFVVTAMLFLSGCGYNTLQSTDEQVKAAWSEVLNQYQRRADLVPNLVEVAPAEWEGICRGVEQALARGAYEQAIVDGIKEISLLLARHYPPRPGGRNELPDKPVVLYTSPSADEP